MKTVVAVLTLLAASFYSKVYADVDCTPGSEWDDKNIRFRCLTDDKGKRGFHPFGCITDKNENLEDTETVETKNFIKQCLQEDLDTYRYDIIACRTPSGKRIEIGSQANEDKKIYFCERDEDTNEIVRYFTEHTKEELNCDFNGKRVKINELVADGDQVFKCRHLRKRDEMALIIWGCQSGEDRLRGNSRRTVRHETLGLVMCRKDKKKAWFESAGQCTDREGNARDVNTKWQLQGIEYRCELRGRGNNKKPVVRPLACLTSVTFTKKGKEQTQKLRVPINKVRKGRDKQYYWCKSQDSQPPAVVEILDANTKCSNGKPLLKSWTVENVKKRCTWTKNGRTKIVDIRCEMEIEGEKKKLIIKKNKVKDYNEKSYKCEKKQKGVLKFRELTEEEYAEREAKKKGEVRDSGSRGVGVRMYSATGKPICEEGFELTDDNQCQDINECEENTHTCNPHERCLNSQGSFDCFCISGMVRNSVTDLCKDKQLGCPC